MDHREQAPTDPGSLPLQSFIKAESGGSVVAPQFQGCHAGGDINLNLNIQWANRGLCSAGASGGRGESPAAELRDTAEEKHFIDIHRLALTERVRNVDAVLDRLMDQGVITQSVYDEIRAESTSMNKMRKMFSVPICAGGKKAKDVLYQILESQEPYLMDDLKQPQK